MTKLHHEDLKTVFDHENHIRFQYHVGMQECHKLEEIVDKSLQKVRGIKYSIGVRCGGGSETDDIIVTISGWVKKDRFDVTQGDKAWEVLTTVLKQHPTIISCHTSGILVKHSVIEQVSAPKHRLTKQ